MLVVDTSVLIDHLRGITPAVARLKAALDAGDELWSVSVVRTEILAGARSGEEARIIHLFGLLRWLDVTPELADAAGRLAATYLRSHPGVDTVDYLIAAGVQHLDAELLTLNVRHFPMLPDLRPAY
ncbi:MAG TPA: type II toxin-antitoxin system VapC family toxin [Candidatus Limnocylindria bacterium]|nr:type II toxin-antitoxin system VapC family toxin [Candidatus Limnocylindria bacterium]